MTVPVETMETVTSQGHVFHVEVAQPPEYAPLPKDFKRTSKVVRLRQGSWSHPVSALPWDGICSAPRLAPLHLPLAAIATQPPPPECL